MTVPYQEIARRSGYRMRPLQRLFGTWPKRGLVLGSDKGRT